MRGGRVGGRVGAVGCSIGGDVRLRRMSQVEGEPWVAVGGAGSRACVVRGALSLDARGRWGVLIGIGGAFRSCTVLLVAVVANVLAAESLAGARAVEITSPLVQLH